MDKKLIVFGTRPEFIKLLPVFREIEIQGMKEDFLFVYTGQHADLPEDFFVHFDFRPDIMIPEKDHSNSVSFSFSYILSSLQKIIDDTGKKFTLSMIIGQGDTTSCACAAMCAFFSEIPFGHIEAGLRTYDLQNPFPEEYFRRIISLATTVHFAPTASARGNLLKEGVSPDTIIVTGNTAVDAVGLVNSHYPDGIPDPFRERWPDKSKNILITCHRRENQNGRFRMLIDTVRRLAEENPSYNFIWLSHQTPVVREELTEKVFRSSSNIFILPPVNVIQMYSLFRIVSTIITDSGGIQEEAPGFNIPVIVIREHTERTESIDLGYSFIPSDLGEGLIGLFNMIKTRGSVTMVNPYGDGKAAERIVNYLKNDVRFRRSY